MDLITRIQARQNLVELAVPPFALEIFDDKPLPKNWDIEFTAPFVLLDADSQPNYGRGCITPLWESCSGYELIAYQHDPAEAGFVLFGLESGEKPEITEMTWNQMLVLHFCRILESGRAEDEIRELAQLLRFDHLDGLIAHSQKPQEPDSSENWAFPFMRELGWHGTTNFAPPIPMDEFIKGIAPKITVFDVPWEGKTGKFRDPGPP